MQTPWRVVRAYLACVGFASAAQAGCNFMVLCAALLACSSKSQGPGTPGDTAIPVAMPDAEPRAEVGDSAAPATDLASVPVSCPASAAGDTPLGTDTPPARWKVTDAITFLNVGGKGSYDRVVDMAPGAWPPPCSDANACVKASKPVSGPLVPFDEEMTMVFSGPIELYDIAVYAPDSTGFSRISYVSMMSSGRRSL